MTADPTRLRALLAEKTPGRWFVDVDLRPNGGLFIDSDDGVVVATRPFGDKKGGIRAHPDATLIVEAVNALPDLLARLERAEAALLYFATDFFIPDATGRWGLPVTVHPGESETEAGNRVYDVETTLTALAASEPPAPTLTGIDFGRGESQTVIGHPAEPPALGGP